MELKNHFKVQLKKVNWQPSIKEVEYIWADWEKHIWLEFEWYASTWELDRGWDVTLPTSFNDTLKSFMENSMMLLQHHDDKPIWNFTEVRIDNNWLWVKWLVKIDTDNVFQKLRTWVLKTMSIWYRVIDWTIEKIDKWWELVDAFIIKSLELFEISLVSVPMNAWAQIKSLNWLSDEQVKSLYNIEKEDIYTFSKSIEDLSNKVKNFNTNNLNMDKDNKEVLEEASENQVVENTETTEVKEEIIEPIENDKEIIDPINPEVVENDPIDITEPTEVIDQPKEEENIEEKTLDNIEIKKIDWEESFEDKLKDALKSKFITDENNESIWVIEFTTDKIVYNHYWFWVEYFDKYMKVLYSMNWDEILLWQPIEVEPEMIWVEKTKEFKDKIETKDFVIHKEKQVEEEIKTETKEEPEIEKEELKEAPEKQAWDIAGEKKSVNIDLKFDTKQIENLTKEITDKLEKEFNNYKEIADQKVNDFITEEKAKFDKSIEDFAWILTEALEVFKSTNEKAVEYISKIENSPIVKTGRYQEWTKKEENALTNLIKQIKR